jgi:murein DD-endopeptidase MepM/ murein hydrolase activator NlpD
MATFPLPARPAQSYSTGGRRFGDDRNSMLHPACDLIAVAGTEIYAVEAGTVIYGPRRFFESGPHVWDAANKKSVCKPDAECLMVYDLLIKHPNFLVRYGEIGVRVAAGIEPSATVTEGQLIAYVGAQSVSSMLHFEMYSNTEDISYPTVKGNMQYLNFNPTKTYSRRKDLMNPTTYLDGCVLKAT